jgi:hypothetical protein
MHLTRHRVHRLPVGCIDSHTLFAVAALAVIGAGIRPCCMTATSISIPLADIVYRERNPTADTPRPEVCATRCHLAKTYGFQVDSAVLDYAAGRLSQGCEAPAFISQNAHGK